MTGPELACAAYKKLAILDAATTINDLRFPRGNRLEQLSADNVELTDYH